MNLETLERVVHATRSLFDADVQKYALRPRQFTTNLLLHGNRPAMIEHALWMLDQVPGYGAAGLHDKAQRWLGNAQALAWVTDCATIDDLRALTAVVEGTLPTP